MTASLSAPIPSPVRAEIGWTGRSHPNASTNAATASARPDGGQVELRRYEPALAPGEHRVEGGKLALDDADQIDRIRPAGREG